MYRLRTLLQMRALRAVRGLISAVCVVSATALLASNAWATDQQAPIEPAPASRLVLEPPLGAASGSFEPHVVDLSLPFWHSAGLMLGMRLSEAVLWPHPFAETRPGVLAQRYSAAFTQPPKWDSRRPWFEWDGDHYQVNVIGHGLFGAELYYRPRACGWSVLASLGFAAGASAIWEYGIEASGVRPSAEDLVYTPLAGALLGEFRLWSFRQSKQIHARFLRGLVRGIVDPFGELERALGTPC